MRVLEYVDNVHRLMAADDIMVTKAGGLSCAEVMASNLPIFLTDSLPGEGYYKMRELFKYIFFISIVYMMIPTVLARFFGLGVLRQLPAGGRIIITFDDGPDPMYTPRVLDVLRAAGVKACFFVIGEKALKYPELIRKIVSEGHEIGSHGFKHRVSWFIGPVGTIKEITKSFTAIKEITGSSPVAYRPPWGLFNLSYWIARRMVRCDTVLWSFMSWDWTKKVTPDIIVKRIRQNMSDGSILIFHDSDTAPGASAGAPEKMLCALPEVLNELKQRGYKTSLLKETQLPSGVGNV